MTENTSATEPVTKEPAMTSKLDEELERLSKAATQGLITILPGANSHCFDGRLMLGNKCIAFVEGDQTQDEDGEYQIVLDPEALLIVELWNAYRTGQLVPAQPSETHAEMVKQLRQLARKQEGYGMSFSDPSPREGGMASINLYGDRAKAAIWLFKNADRIADVLSVASKATQPSQDEVAWLIERDDLRTVESGDRVCLHYYAEHRPGRHHWTPDHLKAKRFPTRENALAECNDDPLLRVCEHMWIGPQPSGDEVEAVALAILNSDRGMRGLEPLESRENVPDSDGYVTNATAAITALDAHRGKQ